MILKQYKISTLNKTVRLKFNRPTEPEKMTLKRLIIALEIKKKKMPSYEYVIKILFIKDTFI